jgi:hypothetical protein
MTDLLSSAIAAARTRADEGADDGAETRLRIRETLAKRGAGRRKKWTLLAAVIGTLFGSTAFALHQGWTPFSSPGAVESSTPEPEAPQQVAAQRHREVVEQAPFVAPPVREIADAREEPEALAWSTGPREIESAGSKGTSAGTNAVASSPPRTTAVVSASSASRSTGSVERSTPRAAVTAPRSGTNVDGSSPSVAPSGTNLAGTSSPSVAPPGTNLDGTSSPADSRAAVTAPPATAPAIAATAVPRDSTSRTTGAESSTAIPSGSSSPRVAPPVPSTTPSSSSSSPRVTTSVRGDSNASKPDGELAAYRIAHNAHFRGTDPKAALAAWDSYLAKFPGGRMALDARYDRALVLVKLERWKEAREALAPFAATTSTYRKAEAAKILDAIRAR